MDADQFGKVMDKLATTLGAQLSTSHKPKEVTPDKLDTIDSIRWMTFRTNFTRVAKLNQWTDARAVPMLQTSLTGAAARAIDHLTFGPATTLESALDQIEAIFVNPAATDFFEVQFDLADKEPGETLVSLHTRYRELFLRAFPAEKNRLETAKRLKDKFALKLGDKGLSYGLTSATDYRTLTYSALLTRAQELQASALRCRQSYNPASTVAKPQLHAIGPSNPASAPSDRRCFFCNNVGHVVKECRKKAAFLRDNPHLRRGAGQRGGPPSRGRGGRGRSVQRPRGRGMQPPGGSYRFQNPRRSLNALLETGDQSSSSAGLGSQNQPSALPADAATPTGGTTSDPGTASPDDAAVASLYAEFEDTWFPEGN